MTLRSPPVPPATCSRFAPSAESPRVAALSNDQPRKRPAHAQPTSDSLLYCPGCAGRGFVVCTALLSIFGKLSTSDVP